MGLPLVTFAEEMLQTRSKYPLRGFHCLAVQHVTESTPSLLQAISDAGIPKRDISVVAKAYSCSRATVSQLKEQSYNVIIAESLERSVPYESVLKKIVDEVLTTLLPNVNRLLLIDEGGNAIHCLHQKHLTLATRVAAVEQTTRGTRVVSSLPLACPVVDVGRSDLKLSMESPVIAEGMLTGLTDCLAKLAIELKTSTLALIGFGAVGRELATRLSRTGSRLIVVEGDVVRRNLARSESFQVMALGDALSIADIVIGCTGNCWLQKEHLTSLKNSALLVNCASSDLEFGIWRFTTAECSDNPRCKFGSVSARYHCCVRVPTQRGHIFILNSGFPIDFTGHVDPIPSSSIQLTRALIFAAAIQSVAESTPGLKALDNEIQKQLERRFRQLCNMR